MGPLGSPVRWIAAVTGIACAVLLAGCAECRWPRIDPSGEHVFVPAPEPQDPRYKEVPAGQLPWEPVSVLLSPRTTVAPVGSEVILLAGVIGPDNYLRMNERVEWMISPGSVGQFVDLDTGTYWNLLLGDFTFPRKLSNTHAVASTSRSYLRLTRGTPTPSDDVLVARGQTWIAVSSPVEGSTYVTAYAREVYGWDRHKQSAAIHWVDAQWRFPTPAIVAAGTRQVLTTTVNRQSDGSPCAGWRVRYTIAGGLPTDSPGPASPYGPGTGFAPGGAQTVEVDTNASGQASVEISQRQPVAGTTRVDIQVIRPTQPGGPPGTGMVLGAGSTLVTWSAPGLSVRKSGPAVGSVGATLTYRVEVTNSGDQPADGVLVIDEIPEGSSYLSSSPVGQPTGAKLQWQLGRLGPGERRSLEVNVRAERVGSLTSCAEATTSGGLRARDCATTAVSLAPPAGITPPAGTMPPSTFGPPTPPSTGPGFPGAPLLDVKIAGPQQATVGEKVRFLITLGNRGQTTATGLSITDTFDPGLVNEEARGSYQIRKPIPGDLRPGDAIELYVDFIVAKAGRLGHTIEVTGSGGVRATAQSQVTALERGVGIPPGPVAPSVPPKPGAAATLTVKIIAKPGNAEVGDNSARIESSAVGQLVLLEINVTNRGLQPLSGVKVTAIPDPALKPENATTGFRKEPPALSWTLPTLAPGEQQQFGIQYRCVQAAAQANVRTQVTSQQGIGGEDALWLPIRAAGTPSTSEKPGGAGPSALTVSVSTLYEPIAAGNSLTYTVHVDNSNPAAIEEKDVRVSVEIPPEMVFVPVGTTGPTQPSIQGRVATFEPLGRLAPGDSRDYRVRVQATKPGQVRIRASVTTQSLREPKTAEARTLIIGG